jgi:hypothetical protein
LGAAPTTRLKLVKKPIAFHLYSRVA